MRKGERSRIGTGVQNSIGSDLIDYMEVVDMSDNRLSLSETDAGRQQKQGNQNMEVTADCIRKAISKYGHQVSVSDTRKCYPMDDLPSFVRLEAQACGNPMGRTLIKDNIRDLSFEGHPGHKFETLTLPDGQEVIVNKPSQPREGHTPTISRARTARPRDSR